MEKNINKEEMFTNAFLKKISKNQIQKLTHANFNKFQVTEITTGIHNGLSPDQVLTYAKPEFNKYQMLLIRQSIEEKMPQENIAVFAKKELDGSQMHEIILGFKDKLTKEQILTYASADYSSEKMEQIRIAFKKGLSKDEIALVAKPNRSAQEMYEMITAFSSGWSFDKVVELSKLEPIEMNIYRKCMDENPTTGKMIYEHLTDENIYNKEQMKEIHLGFYTFEEDNRDLSVKDILTYANPEFTAEQMHEILMGYLQKLPRNKILQYTDPSISADNMKKIRKAITKDKTQIKTNKGFTIQNMMKASSSTRKADKTTNKQVKSQIKR